MYCLRLASRAAKELQGCPTELRTDLYHAIKALASNPRPPQSKKLSGPLKGSHRIRIGSFRVLYDIDDSRRTVLVTKIGPRKSIYR